MPPQPNEEDAAFVARLAGVAGAVERVLETFLADAPRPGEIARPPRLMAAMRHAALAGGKRLRPFLVVETARLLGRDDPGVVQAGAAVELLHCYSLVHDDLPAMDDDDLRRGKPSVHRAFDEATAILAGDALQALAFERLADPAVHPDPAVRSELVLGLARAAGLAGMAGGQMLDLAAEGRYGDAVPGEAEIRRLQAMKTGALLAFAVEAGAILAEADAAARKALRA
jgi:farnesyl diphosphate synthase